MARPRTTNPRRNLVSFRLTDSEYAFLKTTVERMGKDGEKFSETLGRVIKGVLIMEAERQLKLLREKEKPCVTLTVEDIEKRRELARKCSPSFALNPSVVARPDGATHDNTERGQATAKIENLASPSGSAAQRAAESAGKFE